MADVIFVDNDVSNAILRQSLKMQKENFVTGLEGTTMLEVCLVTLTATAFFIFRRFFSVLLESFQEDDKNKNDDFFTKKKTKNLRKSYFLNVFLDFILIIVPTCASMTIWANHVYFVFSVILFLIAALFFTTKLFLSPSLPTERKIRSVEEGVGGRRKDFLSLYRVTVMINTCIIILAVDFKILPRRFAKTETYGTGLMDVGVGSFVFGNALVSKEIQNFPALRRPIGVFRSVSPLLFLGFSRLFLVKGTDYQEHVGEYGVHWNFFFSLASVSLLSSSLNTLSPSSSSFKGVLGILILTGYQMALSRGGWSDYLMKGERGRDLLSANKEGLGSSIGYFSLYLISLEIGKFIFHSLKNLETKNVKKMSFFWKRAAEMFFLDAILWLAALFTDSYIERVSRRTCNMAYVFWILAQNFQVVFAFFLSFLVLPGGKIPLVSAFEKNLLFVFLVANILTGAFNFCFNTLETSEILSFSIICFYMTLVSMIAFLVPLKVKFW